MIVIESPPLGVALAVNTRYRGPERRSLPRRSTGWAQFTRRRKVVCGVNKVRRADTEQMFSSFSTEFVKLSPSAAMVTSTQTALASEAGKQKKTQDQVCLALVLHTTPPNHSTRHNYEFC